jgi:hypothetical protein
LEYVLSAALLFEAAVPPDQWRTRTGEFFLPLVIESKADDWSIVTAEGDRTVSRIALKYFVRVVETPCDAQVVRRYSSMDETLMDQIDSTADLGDVAIKTTFFGRLFKPFPDQQDTSS